MPQLQTTWGQVRRSFVFKVLVASLCFGAVWTVWAQDCVTDCKDCEWWGPAGFKTCRQTFKLDDKGMVKRLARCISGGEVETGDPAMKCVFVDNYQFYSQNNCTHPCMPVGAGDVEKDPGGAEHIPNLTTKHSTCVPKTPEEIEIGL